MVEIVEVGSAVSVIGFSTISEPELYIRHSARTVTERSLLWNPNFKALEISKARQRTPRSICLLNASDKVNLKHSRGRFREVRLAQETYRTCNTPGEVASFCPVLRCSKSLGSGRWQFLEGENYWMRFAGDFKLTWECMPMKKVLDSGFPLQ